jgi:hypothetical protein
MTLLLIVVGLNGMVVSVEGWKMTIERNDDLRLENKLGVCTETILRIRAASDKRPQ